MLSSLLHTTAQKSGPIIFFLCTHFTHPIYFSIFPSSCCMLFFFFIALMERKEKGFKDFDGIKNDPLSPLSHSYTSRNHRRPQIWDFSSEIENLSYWNSSLMKFSGRNSGMKERRDSRMPKFNGKLEFQHLKYFKFQQTWIPGFLEKKQALNFNHLLSWC